MNVGDIFVSIRGDGAQLPKDATDAATKAGDAAGKTFSDRFGSAFRTGFSAVMAGVGVVGAGLTKLANEGADAMAKFQAETGATREEAEAALESMNRLSATNLQSFAVVADVLTSVRTQMGLTGDEAEAMADRILKWSTATGQDAVSATKAFDDVLDAWNLTAADSQSIMDALLVSHQKYGGSVEESEAALSKLAPALTAANLGWEDAVGLINLFNAAGIDAADAVPAMQKALSKVHSPEELKSLLRDIGSTDNAFDRATKAADLFGARGGAKLGAALGASHGDLEQFKVDATEAAGAVDDAASAIEDTLPNKIKLAVSGALSTLRGFGTDLGPALTGSAALLSLGTSFASALKLDQALAGAWAKAGSSSVVQTAAQAAGGLAGKAFVLGVGLALGALLADAIIHGLEDASQKAQNDPSSLEIITGVGGRAPVWAAVRKEAAVEAQKLGEESLQRFNDAWNATIERTNDWHAALAAAKFAAGLDTAFEHDTSFAKRGIGAGGSWAGGFAQGVLGYGGRQGGFWNTTLGPSFEHDTSFEKAGSKAANDFLTGVQDAHYDEAFSDVLRHMVTSVPTAPMRQMGVHFGEQFTVGFKSTRDEAKSEWQAYLDDLAHPNRGQKTVGWIVGKLTGEDLAKGLASSDPIVRHSAEQTQQNLRVQLQGMLDDGYTIGHKTLEKLGLGIQNGKLVAINQAGQAQKDVAAKLDNTGNVYTYGQHLINRWTAGMSSREQAAIERAGGIVKTVGGVFLDDVPIPSTAPEHIRRIGEYGQHFIQRWIGGMWSQSDYARRSLNMLGASITGGLARSSWSPSLSPLLNAGGTATLRHEGTIRVDAPGQTPAAAAALGFGIGSGIGSVLDELDRISVQPVGSGAG